MFIRSARLITFHLTDKCNLNCRGCHWLSSDVLEVKEIGWEHYVNWVQKNRKKISGIKLSGGEPTLYKDFIMLVNNLPEDLQLIINTNGTNINTLQAIRRKNHIQLKVSENRKVDKDFEKNIEALGFICSFHSFNGIGRKQNLEDEVEFGLESNLIGRKGKCIPKFIRFGADGWAYNCEKGLREKDEKLRCDFSLWEGRMNISGKKCRISEICASNFCNENTMRSSFAVKMKFLKFLK
jgi:organic radical activating enzyme